MDLHRYQLKYCKLTQDTAEIASQIVKFILQTESEFQTALNTVFMESAVSSFKALKRALPVTRTKIDWPAICACILC